MKTMNRPDIEKIRQKLEKNLSASRFEHTLGVAYTAACLAMRFGADMNRAFLAGLLHDCAKEYKEKDLLKMREESGIEPTAAELNAPQVLHAVFGPYVAKKKYAVDDPEVLDAIRWHTTGKKDMSLLEQIIFTADYIEPHRDKARDLPEIRPLAFEDLDLCMLRITEDTLGYLETKGVEADPNTRNCFEWLNSCRNKQRR